jgi:glycosyltransferase involved in cell wall biosynthesis
MAETTRKKTLALFTGFYPYSKYEVYLENEVKVLSEQFSEIYIFPLKIEEYKRPVPENCRVFNIFSKKEVSSSLSKVVKANYGLLSKILFVEFLRLGPFRFFKHLKFHLKNLSNYFRYKDAIEGFFKENGLSPDVYYSNWMVDWAVVISILKKSGTPGSFICRTHRYDLYDDKNPLRFVPFAGFVTETLDKIYSISEDGTDYLKRRYPSAKQKVVTSRMGVFDHGVNPDEAEDDTVTIVTCSNLIPVKRIHLVVESLSQIQKNVHWHHFGDGPLRSEIEALAKKELGENIQWKIHGRITSQELMSFYRSQHIDAFINVSDSEGIPVSIMEAISFGIPVIATNVGGNAEVVTADTGLLLKENFSPKQLAETISTFRSLEIATPSFRKQVRKFWEINFDAAKNFSDFSTSLINLTR